MAKNFKKMATNHPRGEIKCVKIEKEEEITKYHPRSHDVQTGLFQKNTDTCRFANLFVVRDSEGENG